MRNFNKTIQMLIFDGNPNGQIMCELSNWNGRVYKISRNNLSKFEERKDAQNTGIYFLFGKDDEGNDAVYIGEAENIYKRLKQHVNDEFYWNDCIAVISKDDLLNKAHVKYLENMFYNFAVNSNRVKLVNSTVPTCSSVDEYDSAMLEEFIDNTKLLVNTLGYKVFESVKQQDGIKSKTEKIQYFYIDAAKGANGKGLSVPDGFAVLKGSVIVNPVLPSMSVNLRKLRQKLIDSGVIDDNYTFVKDYIFTSPSLAAAVLVGRNANGRTEWKTEDNKTLKSIEEKQ